MDYPHPHLVQPASLFSPGAGLGKREGVHQGTLLRPPLLSVTLRSDAIYSARYDGSGHMEVLRGHEFLSHPFAVTLYGGEVYWTDWRTNTLAKANKWTGHNVTVVQRTNTQPFDLQVYHPSRQPMGKGTEEEPPAPGQGGRWDNRGGGGRMRVGVRARWEGTGKDQHVTGCSRFFSPDQLQTHVRPMGAGVPVPTCASSTTTGRSPVLVPIS